LYSVRVLLSLCHSAASTLFALFTLCALFMSVATDCNGADGHRCNKTRMYNICEVSSSTNSGLCQLTKPKEKATMCQSIFLKSDKSMDNVNSSLREVV